MRMLIIMLLIAALLVPHVLLAAPAAQQGAPGESNLGFLFAAFAVVWIVFFAYVFYMGQRQRELRRQIDELRQQAADRQQPDKPS